ncbi:M24 family metallopeptidase [Paenibacillus sinopodophylli]|uniref:M24 family metallopeptidase n=1 Tax=Paenibacillus sinopodophylli TaxID=1837342 RepID=UPI00110CF9B1|nr:Xaa-Pro peptidase family protein [Paenibacillus sinopodophylli]
MLYRNRRNVLQEKLAKRAIEAALVISPASIAYLTGFRSDPMERFMALWIKADGTTTLFVPQLDETKAGAVQGIDRLVPIPDGRPATEALREACGGEPKCCGVEKDALTWKTAEQLAELWPNTEFVDIGEVVGQIRGRKTRAEADLVKTAAGFADTALEAALGHFRRGMKERELAEEIDRQIVQAGGTGSAFKTTVLGGKRSALPHGETGDYAIVEGDILLVDMGVIHEGYLSDMTRTFLVGQGTAEQEKIHETVLEANRRAIAALQTGAPLASVDEAARSWIRSCGYGDYFPHRVGHGLGTEIHEPPFVHGWNEQLVTTGLLITIEPGIYIPGVGGIRIEDDLYVNENGFVEQLTGFSKQLRRL